MAKLTHNLPKKKREKILKSTTGGRPSKLTDDLIVKAKEYLQLFNGNNTSNHLEEVPTIAGLTLYLGISKSTLHSYKDNKDFSDILDKLKSIQEVILINRGLNKEAFNYSSNIVKLLLAKHGYKDDSNEVTINAVKEITYLSPVDNPQYITEKSGDSNINYYKDKK